MDLTVVIVTFNDVSYALGAVASLLQQEFLTEGGEKGDLEIVVVDNHSCQEHARLLEQLPAWVTVVRNDQDLGYGRAANQGAEVATGRYVAFMNPDMRLLPGALQTMLVILGRLPVVGAVGPRLWWHDERQFLMPPNDNPTLPFLFVTRLSPLIPALGRLYDHWWHRRAVDYWRRVEPITVPVLGGACVVTRREVLAKVGGFDPSYFLYYEDTDWARRVRSAGYRLVYTPQAEAIHYYNQSPKTDTDRIFAASEARFYAKHYGRRGRAALAILDRLAALYARRRAPTPPSDMISLGQPEKPPLLRIDGCQAKGGLLIEVSHSWTFVPATGAFLDGPECEIPPSIWDRLQTGPYYARVVDLATFKPLRSWSWQKN